MELSLSLNSTDWQAPDTRNLLLVKMKEKKVDLLKINRHQKCCVCKL